MREHDIALEVREAQQKSESADMLVRKYLPFIRAAAAKCTGTVPHHERDDVLSIAMLAFHEAVLAYSPLKGPFLPFASRAIRMRLIDYGRRQQRHRGHLSLHTPLSDAAESDTLLDTLSGGDNVETRSLSLAAREEILEFSEALSLFGLSLTDVAESCPRQQRTLAACRRALEHAKANPALIKTLLATKKLPLAALAEGAGVERKTLERHRKYMLALLLAYTNGFEIIRSHLGEISFVKGGAVS